MTVIGSIVNEAVEAGEKFARNSDRALFLGSYILLVVLLGACIVFQNQQQNSMRARLEKKDEQLLKLTTDSIVVTQKMVTATENTNKILDKLEARE